jgi:hypothetical protein
MPNNGYYAKDEYRKQRDSAMNRLEVLEKDREHIIAWLEEIVDATTAGEQLKAQRELLTLALYIKNL